MTLKSSESQFSGVSTTTLNSPLTVSCYLKSQKASLVPPPISSDVPILLESTCFVGETRKPPMME